MDMGLMFRLTYQLLSSNFKRRIKDLSDVSRGRSYGWFQKPGHSQKFINIILLDLLMWFIIINILFINIMLFRPPVLASIAVLHTWFVLSKCFVLHTWFNEACIEAQWFPSILLGLHCGGGARFTHLLLFWKAPLQLDICVGLGASGQKWRHCSLVWKRQFSREIVMAGSI